MLRNTAIIWDMTMDSNAKFQGEFVLVLNKINER